MKVWTKEEQEKAAERVFLATYGTAYLATHGTTIQAGDVARKWAKFIDDASPTWRETNPGVARLIDLQCELNEARELIEGLLLTTAASSSHPAREWLFRNTAATAPNSGKPGSSAVTAEKDGR